MNIYITGPEDLIPTYAHDGDAGCDLRAAENLVIKANDWKLVKTGISIALPANMVALVHPRSGLALRHGITVLNAPGTIDSGYRGEIGVILYNAGDISFPIFRGDRIAQMVFQQFDTPTFIRVDSLNDSERGDGGFGSSGLN